MVSYVSCDCGTLWQVTQNSQKDYYNRCECGAKVYPDGTVERDW